MLPATEVSAGVVVCFILGHMALKDTVVQNLFDGSGRRIPDAGLGGPVNPASHRYSLAQPSIDYAGIHARTAEHLQTTGLPSAAEFADRAQAVLETLRRGEQTAALASAVRVPFMLGTAGYDDLGQSLDEVYLPALARSWKARFTKYDFKNELTGRLAGKVGIAEGSAYDRLVEAMSEGPVVGYYFPLALLGFSVTAARQQMSDLPGTFALSGGHEACAALIGCPDLIMKADGYPPQLELAALQGPATGYGYHFAPYGYNLTFNGRYHNGQSSDYVSPGLTVIAPSGKKK
jgi:hypothetical protein